VNTGSARPITIAPAIVASPPASALICGDVSDPRAPACTLPSCPPRKSFHDRIAERLAKDPAWG
jgi:hypothetical protein